MKHKLIMILSITFLFACVEKKEGEHKPSLLSSLVSITDNEDKGVKEVLNHYSGICKYAIGFEGAENYFELEMSECEYFTVFPAKTEQAASNIAYLFYRNLKSERKEYNFIRVSIITDSNKSESYDFPTPELKTVDEQMFKVEKLVALLKSQNYKEIENMLDESMLIKQTKNEYIAKIKSIDPQFGTINNLLLNGYYFKNVHGKQVLHVMGTLTRSIQASAFSVDIEVNSSKDKILLFNYQE